MRDRADVARLLVAHRIDARTIARDPVLRGHIQLVIVDPALVKQHGHAIEDRLIGVTVALCESYGCTEIDVAGHAVG